MSARTAPEIVLGVTGSIAAYKAAELVRLLFKAGWGVTVVMTADATKFVGPLTFQTLSRRPVTVDMFAQPEEWIPGHISLADRASALVVAPCTANVIAKLALGLADDALSATALACPAPLVVAPAMNVHMWDHPATQANVATLRKRGATVLDVGVGDLACGYEARGRMAEPAAIMKTLTGLLARRR
jgi:phosphopantothenoylcysteine decarboxylase/phosphopantothenate--cysteine ligase